MNIGSAFVALLTIVVKGGVMVAGLWLIYNFGRVVYNPLSPRPWRRIPREHVLEMKVIWWSLVLFFVAESSSIFRPFSPFITYAAYFDMLHSYASGIAMSAFALGIYVYFNTKLFHYGREDCFPMPICRICTIKTPEGCKFRLLFCLMGLFVVMAALFCFWIPARGIVHDPQRLAVPLDFLNDWFESVMIPYFDSLVPGYDTEDFVYSIPKRVLLTEFRFMPVIALFVALLSMYSTWNNNETLGIKFLVMSIGLLAYVYFEIILYHGSGDALLGSFGHELVELWFLITLLEFLRRVFSRV